MSAWKFDPDEVDTRIAAADAGDLVALIETPSAVGRLSLEQQVALAKHRSVDVPRALAKHAPDLSPEAIRVVARSRIFTARRNLAKSGGSSLPVDVLELLADDEDDVVRKTIAAVWTPDPEKISADVNSRQAKTAERVVEIARAASLDPSEIETILKAGEMDELLALIGNPSLLAECSDEQQVRIARHRSVEVPRALAHHAAMLCPEAVRTIAESRIYTARRALVRFAGSTLPPDIRVLLSSDDDEIVRKLVADIGDQQTRRGVVTMAPGGDPAALEKKAKFGDVAATVTLGLYAWEAGDLKRAKHWLAKAAEAGDVLSMLDLETIATDEGDHASARTWLRAAATAEYLPAVQRWEELKSRETRASKTRRSDAAPPREMAIRNLGEPPFACRDCWSSANGPTCDKCGSESVCSVSELADIEKIQMWAANGGEQVISKFITDKCDVDKVSEDDLGDVANWKAFVSYLAEQGHALTLADGTRLDQAGFGAVGLDDHIRDQADELRYIESAGEPSAPASEFLSVSKGRLLIFDPWWRGGGDLTVTVPVRDGRLVEKKVSDPRRQWRQVAIAFVTDGISLDDAPVRARYIGEADLESGIFAVVDADNRGPFVDWIESAFVDWIESDDTSFGCSWGNGDGFSVNPRGTDVHATPVQVFDLVREGATVGLLIPLGDWEADPCGLERFAPDIAETGIFEDALDGGEGWPVLERWLEFAGRVGPDYLERIRTQVDAALMQQANVARGDLTNAFGEGSLGATLDVLKSLATVGSTFARDALEQLKTEFGPRVDRVTRVRRLRDDANALVEREGRLELRRAERVALVEAALNMALDDGLTEQQAIEEVAAEFGMKLLSVNTIMGKLRRST